MAANPIFVGTIANGVGALAAANTNRDGTGTIVDILTAATLGSLIEFIEIIAAGTTTAGMIRLYLSDGTTTRLWREIPVQAVTPSATVPVWSYRIPADEIPPLAPLWKLRASTHNVENFNVFAPSGSM